MTLCGDQNVVLFCDTRILKMDEYRKSDRIEESILLPDHDSVLRSDGRTSQPD